MKPIIRSQIWCRCPPHRCPVHRHSQLHLNRTKETWVGMNTPHPDPHSPSDPETEEGRKRYADPLPKPIVQSSRAPDGHHGADHRCFLEAGIHAELDCQPPGSLCLPG